MDQILSPLTQSQLENLIAERFADEPEWSRSRRLQALSQYLTVDWPKLERTPLKKRRLGNIAVDEMPPRVTSQPLIPTSEASLQFVNNYLVDHAVSDSYRAHGIIVAPLRDSLDHPAVEQYLGSLIDENQDKITALNGALWQNGAFIWIPDHLDQPVTVTLEQTITGKTHALLSRHLIVVGEHSRLIINVRHSGDASVDKALFVDHTEIIAQAGSDVHYGVIQLLPHHVEGFVSRAGRVKQDADLHWNVGEFGAALMVSGHISHLDEPGATTHSTTVFFGSAQQHQDYTAHCYHHAHHTNSDMVARGVMKGHARSIFTGLTEIDQGARGSDGRQREQTLMLSDESRADAIPSLVINEHDVFAAHAASAGPVDRAAIFYLTSRGLSEEMATRLIVHGFLAPVIDSISDTALRAQVWDAVERKIVE